MIKTQKSFTELLIEALAKSPALFEVQKLKVKEPKYEFKEEEIVVPEPKYKLRK